MLCPIHLKATALARFSAALGLSDTRVVELVAARCAVFGTLAAVNGCYGDGPAADWGEAALAYDAALSAIDAGAPAAVAVRAYGAVGPSAGDDSSLGPVAVHAVHAAHAVADPGDPGVAMYRPKSLRDHQLFHRTREALLQQGQNPSVHGGRRVVTRMLEAQRLGRRVGPLSFLCTEELRDTVIVPAIQKRTAGAGGTAAAVAVVSGAAEALKVFTASKEVLEQIRGAKINTGDAIFSLLTFPMTVPLSELLLAPPIIILDNVRNAENIGSILRTAYCLGITSVVASSTAWGALRDTRSARCSMGTIYFHRLHLAESVEAVLTTLRARKFTVYAAEITPSAVPVHPHGTNRNWGLVLGNEDLGVREGLLALCDEAVMIPQASGDSLNVGHAAAISLFQLGREMGTRQHDGSGFCK